jgi:hypothetical protein
MTCQSNIDCQKSNGAQWSAGLTGLVLPGQKCIIRLMKKALRVPITHFAPAERVPIEIIQRQAAELGEPTLPFELMDSVRNYVFILNQQRQIVFVSRNVRDLTPGKTPTQLLGLRPGEALGCIHADECPGGCGASPLCQECGALQAMLRSLAGNRELRQYRLTRFIGGRQQSLQLLVMAAPLFHNRELYSLFAITDGSDAKSRRAMERFFTKQTSEPARLSSNPPPPKHRRPTQPRRRH